MGFLDQLHEQLGGMYWYVVIAVPLAVVLFVGQIVWRVRNKTKQVRQALRAGSLVSSAGGPTTGPLAYGLACGAPQAVNQGVAWNDLSGAGFAKQELREDLLHMWGVADADDWRHTAHDLLDEHSNSPIELALRVRRHPAGWADQVRQAHQAGALGVVDIRPVLAAVERITRYEDRFRADGILPAGHLVRTVRCYNWCRAVNMARWGLSLGFCDRADAERVVLRAGQLCAAHYTSWADLSLGFALGRMLSFDDDAFAVWYASTCGPHRLLLSEPNSPWRTMPWPTPAVRP